MKKIFTVEIKIAIAFILTIALAFVGLNFLKGINVFKFSHKYYSVCKNLDGLVESDPVKIKGYKIGQVTRVKYNFGSDYPFVVEVSINKDIELPKGTILTIADNGLMGEKIIDLELGSSAETYSNGDTLPSTIRGNMLSQLSEYAPKISRIMDNIDSITTNINAIVDNPNLNNSINSLNSAMSDFNKTMAQIKTATATMPQTMSDMSHIASSLKLKVDEFDTKNINNQINATLKNLDDFTKKLNSNNSSLGLLLNDRSLFDNINKTVQSVDNLMIDIKTNPKRYINISVFGKK